MSENAGCSTKIGIMQSINLTDFSQMISNFNNMRRNILKLYVSRVYRFGKRSGIHFKTKGIEFTRTQLKTTTCFCKRLSQTNSSTAV